MTTIPAEPFPPLPKGPAGMVPALHPAPPPLPVLFAPSNPLSGVVSAPRPFPPTPEPPRAAGSTDPGACVEPPPPPA